MGNNRDTPRRWHFGVQHGLDNRRASRHARRGSFRRLETPKHDSADPPRHAGRELDGSQRQLGYLYRRRPEPLKTKNGARSGRVPIVPLKEPSGISLSTEQTTILAPDTKDLQATSNSRGHCGHSGHFGHSDQLAFAFFTSSVRAGTTSNRSPTIPRSATLKIGASASLLIATMCLDERIPARC